MSSKPTITKAPSRHRAKQRAKDYRAGIEAAKSAVLPLIRRTYFLRGMAAGVVVCAVLSALALYLAYKAGILTVSL